MHYVRMKNLYPLALKDGSGLFALPPADTLLARVLELVHALRLHLNTVSRLGRSGVVTVLDDTRVEEVLVQMVDVFEHTELAADNNVIDGAQVLSVLGKTDTTRVRNDRHTKLLCDEKDGKNLVDTSHAAGIDLADIDGTLLQQLLENDTVLAHLAGSNTNSVRLERLADSLVTENVVRAGRLLDEPRLELGELLHVLDGLRDGPDLVGIDHEEVALVVADDLSGDAQSLLVFGDAGSDLELEVFVTGVEGLLQQALHLVLAITQPTSTGCVGRHRSVGLGMLDTLSLAGLLLLQHLNGLLFGDGICDVSEINARNELLRRHVSNNSPDGLVEGLGPQVPDGVDNGTKSKVNDTLLRANPSQLTVRDEVSPGLAPVGDKVLELLTLHTGRK